MRCLLVCSLGLSVLIAASGCRSCDRVESELRARENDVRELREELDRCGVYNQTLQQEVHALRGQLGMPLSGPPPAAYPVQKLTLGAQSGGRSNNVCPGDDSLQVEVEPRDPDNHVIKAPGQLLIMTEEITPEGLKRPLSSWMIPPDLLRKSWVNGLLTTGYLLNLPWKIWPSTEKLHISVQFQVADGRLFGADRDVTVRLTPLNQRPGAAPLPADQGRPMLLPAPRPVDPAKPINPTPSDPAKPINPAPSDPSPGPLLGIAPLTPEEQTAEILRPMPLKLDSAK